MKKSGWLSLLVIFLLVPLTLYLGTRVKGRWYYLISTLVVIEIMLPFFFRFEARRPQPRELVMIAVRRRWRRCPGRLLRFCPGSSRFWGSS